MINLNLPYVQDVPIAYTKNTDDKNELPNEFGEVSPS
jgi:hypothetical protein